MGAGIPTGDGASPPGVPGAVPEPARFAGPDGPADVAVLVVTYNSAGDLPGLLASLRREAGSAVLRVVVADNASRDDTLEVARRQGDVIAVESGGNLGYAGGINVAYRHAGDAAAVLILNPDLVVEPGCVAALLARMESEAAGVVVPAIARPDGTLTDSLRREPSLLRSLGDALFGRLWPGRPAALSETVRGRPAYSSPCQVDWATGAALLVSRAAADRVGPWDERFFMYSEETDYFRRVRAAGFPVWYEPSALVTHREGGSGASPELVALMVVNMLRYTRKYRPLAVPAHYCVLLLQEARRWGNPAHRLALLALIRRVAWADLPHATDADGTRRVVPAAPGRR